MTDQVQQLERVISRQAQLLAMERGEGIPGMPEWQPTLRGRYYKILVERQGPGLPLSWICVEPFVCLVDGKFSRWMATYADTRLHPDEDNPEDISEITFHGDDPIALIEDMQREMLARGLSSEPSRPS